MRGSLPSSLLLLRYFTDLALCLYRAGVRCFPRYCFDDTGNDNVADSFGATLWSVPSERKKCVTDKARIIIVEDETQVAENLTRSLIALGYETVAVAGSGEEAIEFAADLKLI